MRRFVTITFFALVNLNFIYPQIQLTSPNGGEIWSFGSSYNITWTNGAASVTIDYSINGGVNWYNITSGQSASGTFSWNVTVEPTTQALIKVSDGSTLDSNSFFFIKSPQTFVNPVKILPIGNSITSDNFRAEFRFAQDKISYRYNLWDSLRTNNYDVDYIGHKSGGYYQFPDPENNGIPGIKDNEILTLLRTGEVWLGSVFEMQATPGPYLNYYTPDIILLHIGTNGVHDLGGTSPDEVEAILNLIDVKSQDIWVVLALIIDDADPDSAGYSYDITNFNNNIKSMAQARINSGDKLLIVDMQHDANLIYLQDVVAPHDTGDMYDDIHPNDSGKVKIANLWFQGLQLILPNPETENPVITSTEVTTVYVGLPYRYDVNASGVGAPNYSLTTAPAGMTINSKTGIIDWPNPTGSSANVSVTATHPTNSTTSTQTFTINISAAPSLPSNLVSYWRMDETGAPTSFEDLPGINNALPINAPSIDSGIVGNALNFNGTDSKVDVIDDSSLYFQKNESFTFETWVKTTQAGSDEPIFLGKDGGSTSYTLGIITSNQTKFEIKDSVGNTYFVSGLAINDGNWHHVAGQVDRGVPNNKLSIYIDGERYDRSPNPTFHSSGFFSYDPLTLGYYKNDNFFNGMLDEVAIYNRRVPGFELARHYISGLARKGYTDNYVLVNAKVFLQGPYNGTDMNTTLKDNSYIPKALHPYSTAPWNYNGLERVATYPVPDIGVVVDWVLVELRSDPNTVVARRAAFIKNDGNLVEIHDNLVEPRPIIFTGVSPGNYYIVIKHRNHLGIMSASAVPLSYTEPATLYDFTSGDGSQFYPGNSSGAKLLKTAPINVWGMMGGDSNSSGIITNSDQDPINSNLNLPGYYNGDTNMSGIVTNSDKDFVNGNINKSSQVPK